MNSYLSLTKTFISALSMSKTNDKKRKIVILILSIIALIGIMIPGALLLGFFVGVMTYDLLELGVSTFALQLVLEVIAIFSFVFGISVILNELYFSNDIEYVLPWPLRIWQIVASKFTAAYIGENLMQILFIIASIVGFGLGANIGLINWILALLGFLFLPLLPMVYCAIICMIIMRFTRIIKNKDAVQKATIFMIFAILLVVMIAVGSIGDFDFNNFSGDINDIGNKYFGILNVIFPTINLFVRAVGEGNILFFIGYMLINVIAVIVMLVLAEAIYFKGVIGLSINGESTKENMKVLLKKSEMKPVFYSYFMKEVRILMRTPTFYTHCIVSNFIWPVFVYAIFKALGNSVTLDWIITNYGIDHNIQLFLIVFIVGLSAFLPSLNSISSNAISREGKHFAFMKNIPVNYKIQWNAKALVGSVFAFIGIMVFFIPACIIMKIPFLHILGCVFLSVLAILFVSYMGIYIDSIQPKLVWDDELSVLRENYNMFFSMAIIILFVGVVSFGGYFMFKDSNLSFSYLFIIFGLLLVICNVIMYLISNRSIVKNIEEQEEM